MGILLLATCASTHAQSTQNVCANPVVLPTDSAPPTPTDEGELILDAGAGEISLDGDVLLREGVTAARGLQSVSATEGRYTRDTGTLSLSGAVSYKGNGADIASTEAVLSYVNGEVSFADAKFSLGNGAARGAASLLRVDRGGTLDLEEVNYTTCPEGDDEWIVRASSIRLDTQRGIGEARGLTLRFKDVPILYSPWLSFPISEARKTGFLLPNFRQSGLNGLDISVPWYWNIAPAYDATITPRVLTRRGVQLDTLARYLTEQTRGRTATGAPARGRSGGRRPDILPLEQHQRFCLPLACVCRHH